MAVNAPAAQCNAVRRDRLGAELVPTAVRVGEVLVETVVGAVVGTGLDVPEVPDVAVSDVSDDSEVVVLSPVWVDVVVSVDSVDAVVSVDSVDCVDSVGSVTAVDSTVADVSVDSVGAVELEDTLGVDDPTSAVPVTVLAHAETTRATEHSRADRRNRFMPAAY